MPLRQEPLAPPAALLGVDLMQLALARRPASPEGRYLAENLFEPRFADTAITALNNQKLEIFYIATITVLSINPDFKFSPLCQI